MSGQAPRVTAEREIRATELHNSGGVISCSPKVTVSVVFDYGDANQALFALTRAVESVRDQIAQTA